MIVKKEQTCGKLTFMLTLPIVTADTGMATDVGADTVFTRVAVPPVIDTCWG